MKLAGATALAALAINMQAPTVNASDHIDGSVGADAAADIGDLYAWHNGEGNVVVVLTFAGLLNAGDDPVYDEGVLYTIHIDNTADMGEASDFLDNDNDNESDIDIYVRLGSNEAGDHFIQVTNLPGADAELVGPTEETVGDDTARAYYGVFDDPFFFDIEGFNGTAMNLVDDADPNDIAFAGLAGDAVDGFEGTNTMAIVLEFPAEDALNGNTDNFLQIWGTTGRVPR